MSKDFKPKRITTPKGVFIYPHLVTPDYGTDAYPKKGGEYNVKLRLDEEAAETLRELCAEALEAAEAQAKEANKKRKPQLRKQNPLKAKQLGVDVFDDSENETGEVDFNLKTKASGVDKNTGDKWTKRVALFDAKGKPLVGKNIQIWSGTVGRFTVMPVPYFIAATGEYGVTLRLIAAQIINLVNGSAGSAEDYGFDVEDGYSAEDESDSGFVDEDVDNDSDDDDDDDSADY